MKFNIYIPESCSYDISKQYEDWIENLVSDELFLKSIFQIGKLTAQV